MKVVDLFCGAGGSALGALSRVAGELICYDNAPEAVETVGANCQLFGSKEGSVTVSQRNLILDPVVEVSGVDLVIAGPPCQPFSLGGRRGGFSDIRSGFGSVATSIEALKPKAFVVENVEGISFADFREDLGVWVHRVAGKRRLAGREFKGRSGEILGRSYWCSWRVMNAANYGLPQMRKRWILVGIRNDLYEGQFGWPEKTHGLQELVHAQKVTGSYWKEHCIRPPRQISWFRDSSSTMPDSLDRLRWNTCRDVVNQLPRPKSSTSGTNYRFGHYLRDGVRNYRGHSGSWVDFPAKTIKAGSHGVPGGENALRFTNGRLRYMTLQECALIQGFPREFRFDDSFTKVVRMIGNACPPVLIERIVAHLRSGGVIEGSGSQAVAL